ncbi:MAG TPA: glycosyltransferase family 4 protein [Stellaceae bacterium]|nr:glycosyltransferase family 4 protein [Stellaceae bacterium]
MAAEPRRKLIFVVTEDWFFWSHRRPMAKAALDAGFDVAVATRVSAHGERIRALGLRLLPMSWRRGNLGPWASLKAVAELYRLYRRERPLIVLHVSLKTVLLGGIAAALARVPAVVSVVTGTGYLGGWQSFRARLVRTAATLVWRFLLLRGNRWVIVENEDDRRACVALRPAAAARVVVIAGSGVDLEHFKPMPMPPAPPIVCAYVGRMIAIKGIATLVEAQQRVRRSGTDLRLVLVGAPDPENPTSIDAATLRQWSALPGVSWLGRQEDVRSVWAGAHIAVLTSLGGEGLPMSLVEAAAMGRPIVATAVPGNRAIAQEGINALLVQPDDPAGLADALTTLAGDAERRRRFGEAGRRLAEASLSAEAVAAATRALYGQVLAQLGDGGTRA